MLKTLFRFAAVFLLMCMPLTATAAEFTEGKNYFVLEEPGRYQESDKIEVIMFLWYGCSGCYKLDPKITAWAEQMPADVQFTRLPALFFPNWELHGRVYLTLDKMGYTYDQHYAIFPYVQKRKKDEPETTFKLEDEENLPEFLDKIGVDKEAFMAIYNSEEITNTIQDIHFMIPRFEVHAVPAMVINGKYKFTIKDVEGKHFIELADFLIQKERDAVKK